MTNSIEYYVARNVEEALAILGSKPEPTLPIAGGTDLLVEIKQGRRPDVHALVDITRIPELSVIEQRGQELFIGAGVPLSLVIASPLVQFHAAALAEACQQIGGPQVRAVATLGGNVAHALPAADGAVALVALDAQAEVAFPAGRRRVALTDLYLGPGQTTLRPRRDLLVGFYLPRRREGQASGFERVMRPQGVALAIVNCAVWVERKFNRIAGVRIALGPGGPKPNRAEVLEKALRGEALSAHTFEHLGEVMREAVKFRTSPHRASAEYRYLIAGALLSELLSKVWTRTESIQSTQ